MNLKKIFLIGLKISIGILVTVLLLLIAAAVLLHNESFQNKILKDVTQLLSEKMDTKVQIDSVSFSLYGQYIHLYGIEVEDREQRKFLQLDTLSTSIKLWPLLKNEVRLSGTKVAGLRAELYKDSLHTPANYQFIIDAFKSDKKKSGKKVRFGMSRGRLSRVKIHYQTKEKPYDHDIQLVSAEYRHKSGRHLFTINQLIYQNDNHKPLRRTGKPKRGYFDEGHFNAIANLEGYIDHFDKDSIHAVLTSANILDRRSGLDVRNLTFQVATDKQNIYLHDVNISLPGTMLTFSEGQAQLKPFSYHTSTISGTTILKDIAKPFALVLGNFTIPLRLNVDLSGNDSTMYFKNVNVSTVDHKLTIAANGNIQQLNKKRALNVNFHVNPMRARGNITQRIINQFPVKKFLMKQLSTLGTITYRGNFHVKWHREAFEGTLGTQVGNLQFTLDLNEDTKYLNGSIFTDSIQLDKLFNMPKLGKVSCKASFTFDYSKKRTAQVRKKLGGKLPIGSIQAEVPEANYKSLKIKNVSANIRSNGAIAQGNLNVKGKSIDLLCAFSFTNTDSIQKMKIKPGLKFHKYTDEDKAEIEQKKEQKRAAKQQKAAEKAAAKEQKAAEKAARKQQKAAEKEARKQQKAAEKEARKQQKAAEKAARANEKKQ